MLVVVASRHHRTAREIVNRWSAHEGALLACEDLSTPGWQHWPCNDSASMAVVSGQLVRESDIRGVLVQRPWVFETELVHIAAEDREYVAAEMNAFLHSWLAHLSCPVLNRPSGISLCGPSWRAPQWALAAQHAGMTAETRHWRVPEKQQSKHGTPIKPGRPHIRILVVGERCFGAPNENYAASAKRLAAIANTPLLAIYLAADKRRPYFIAADPIPSLEDQETSEAARDYLLGST